MKSEKTANPTAVSLQGHYHARKEPMLICKDASLGYERHVVLQNLNFTIQTQDYICIIGENGSGKSTLVKSLLGLIRPLGGSVTNCACLERGSIGYLPQQTKAQRNFPATVAEVVRSGFLNKCGFRPFYTKKEKDAAEKNMEKLGILGLKDRCYRELSGGQQQRVLLARALCAANKLLILDEPVTGLDPVAASELYSLLKKINEEENIAVVMVTHDMHHALTAAKKILYLASDHYSFGTTEDFLKSADGERFSEELKKEAVEETHKAERRASFYEKKKEAGYDASFHPAVTKIAEAEDAKSGKEGL